MKLAWIKFYPADWRADPALRMCSLGARGLWMEMLCLMHEAEPRGSLLISGKTVTPRLLAGIVSVSPDEIEHWTSELEAAGVFSRDDDGVIYSRRMRRDEARSEVHRANGAKGGNPRLKPGDNLEDKPQSPDSRLQNRRARTSASRAEPAGEMIALGQWRARSEKRSARNDRPLERGPRLARNARRPALSPRLRIAGRISRALRAREGRERVRGAFNNQTRRIPPLAGRVSREGATGGGRRDRVESFPGFVARREPPPDPR